MDISVRVFRVWIQQSKYRLNLLSHLHQIMNTNSSPEKITSMSNKSELKSANSFYYR